MSEAIQQPRTRKTAKKWHEDVMMGGNEKPYSEQRMASDEVKTWHEEASRLEDEYNRAYSKFHSFIEAQKYNDWAWLNENRGILAEKYPSPHGEHSIGFFNQEVVWNCDFKSQRTNGTPLDGSADKYPYAQRINIYNLLRRAGEEE